ncbi:ovalbumin-related protein X-like [Pomacea canaliculata]|uniref:ovalbumin-related protein X-like n=1 Tax=Pomacea canaliculata TaxID=400727 RepID=UPI000D73FE25|nr:ovalbumin-related protein X-like [Pomacea canaliculata]
MAKLFGIFVLACLLTLGDCHLSVRQASSSLAHSSGDFGTKLYKKLVADNKDNVVFSPITVYTALCMTLLAAKGDTKLQLQKALDIKPDQNIHSELRDVLTSVLSPDQNSDVKTRLANAIYYDPAKITIGDSFRDDIINYYGLNALKRLQQQNRERDINAWVNDITSGAITKLVEQGEISSDKAILLLNAIFFEGSWEAMFPAELTRDMDFQKSEGDKRKVRTMHQENFFAVKRVEDEKVRVLELPYKGNRFSLYVILPDTKEGLQHLEGHLDGQVLDKIVNSMPQPRLHKVYLPKMELSYRKKLDDKLFDMGLDKLFDNRADLSGMQREGEIKRDLYINGVHHKAKIEVTESGTRAAPVTEIKDSRNFALPEFKADRPFMFVLREKKNDINVLIGRFKGPAAREE